jgi:hypothetical protein
MTTNKVDISELDQEELAEIQDEPTYRPNYGKIVVRLLRAGCVEKEIEEYLGANSKWSISKWRKNVKRFDQSCAKAQADPNKNVFAALYKICQGYEYNVKTFDKDGETVKAVKRFHQPPNEAAIEFWLCNQDPDNWKKPSKPDMKNKLSNNEMGEIESDTIRQYAGRLLSLCTENDEQKSGVQAETPLCTGERPGTAEGVPDDVSEEAGTGIRHDVLDVQSEREIRLPESAVYTPTKTG